MHELALRQVLLHVESNTLYHSLASEVLFNVWILHLFLLQLEDGSVEALLESVVVESSHRHLLIRVRVLDKFEQLLKHLSVVTTVKLLLVLFLFLLLRCLHVCVEIDLVLEELVIGGHLLLVFEQSDLRQFRVLSEHLSQSTSSAVRPQFLRIFSLHQRDLLE